ncbi:broad substrate specificity ATP-binding cassette transporter ABCG2-like [Diadema antillarum]|uniref:broad substrate specificity ATP-binding cassette transporter ABCG2-like n=1 Tax=Diadema antillarum TaxID=105358 RepID=UPI003A87B8E9
MEQKTLSSAATISCHDVHYFVQTGGRCKKGGEKEILKGITGVFAPGLNALLGPTGSGKTSLLDILAGRKDKRGIRGKVLINGNKLPSNFKLSSGYVVQDDVIMGTLTVRENLAFSAALRLPGNISSEEKRARVDEIITELGLDDCKDTKVGTEFLRGVSGGERKRTNIGMELIIRPSVLFLDEPTTGLDANTAFTVVSRLAALAKKGRTVILSIHQPRFSIFKLFDTLHLLAKGETVYHGPSQDSLDYFASIGYECEAHNNPPDFFLDVLNSAGSADASDDQAELSDGALQAEEGKSVIMADVKPTASSFADKFRRSQLHRDLEEKSANILKLHESENADSTSVANPGYPTGFFTQVAVIARRALLNYKRNIQVSIVQPIMAVFFATIMGLVYLDVGDDFPSGTQNRTGAMFFSCIFMIFSNMAAMELFIEERRIFIHETNSGFYRTIAYFIAKVTCDLVPMRIVPTVLFSVIYYFMIGLRHDAAAFFTFLLTLLMATFCGTGLVFLLAITIGIISIATVFVTAINIIMFVFGGVLVNTASVGDWIEWLKYFSVIRYAFNALSINEFRGLTFCRANSTFCITGEDYLSDLDIGHTEWDLWQNHVAMACFIVGLFFLCYIQLLRVPRHT